MEVTASQRTEQIALPTIAHHSLRHLPLKRSFDIFFSLMALLLGLPILALIALLIKLTSRGPAIYSQQRIGRGGVPFRCYKFRTMRPDAEETLRQLLASDPAAREEWLSKRKLTRDPRVTPIGSFLRKTCLDELPQFWNVLRGDLSIVGPRPVCADEITQFYGVKAYKILSVRPGVTGIWQTSDRRTVTYPERIAMDEEYVEKQSFPLDLLLILKTIPAMFRPRGAC